MALDPKLNPVTPRDSAARLTQRLAFVESNQRSSPHAHVLVPFDQRVFTSDGIFTTGSTDVILPGNTNSLDEATGVMCDIYAQISTQNVTGTAPIGMSLRVRATNNLWSFTTDNWLIMIDSVPVGTTFRTYASVPGVRPTPEYGLAPAGSWISAPLVAGPTTLSFDLVFTNITALTLVSGFASVRVNP